VNGIDRAAMTTAPDACSCPVCIAFDAAFDVDVAVRLAGGDPTAAARAVRLAGHAVDRAHGLSFRDLRRPHQPEDSGEEGDG
jgi:hypothetical protein